MKIFNRENLRASYLLSSLINAFSTYSILPMPQKIYRKEELKYSLALFPLVGLATGLLLLLITSLSLCLDFSPGLFAVLSYGGGHLFNGFIHLDGLADAADAIFSRREREEMLRIMHDPHIGPMAVLCLILHIALSLALTGEVYARLSLQGLTLRTVCGLLLLPLFWRSCTAGLVLFKPKARSQGMAARMSEETDSADKTLLLFFMLLSATLLSLCAAWQFSLLCLLLLAFSELFSRYCQKKFGGVSGDLAGTLLCLLENLSLFLILIGLILFA